MKHAIKKVYEMMLNGKPIGVAIHDAAEMCEVNKHELAKYFSSRSAIKRKLQSEKHIRDSMDILYSTLGAPYTRTPIDAYYETNNFIKHRAIGILKNRKDISNTEKEELINYIRYNVDIPSFVFDDIWDENSGYGLIREPDFTGTFLDFLKSHTKGTQWTRTYAKEEYEARSGNTISLCEVTKILDQHNAKLCE